MKKGMKRMLNVVLAVLVFLTSVNVNGLQVQAEEVQEQKDISECTFVGIQGKCDSIMLLPSQWYTGSQITPSVTIKDGDYTLQEGVDYSVSAHSSADNVNVNVTPWNFFSKSSSDKFAGIVVFGKGKYKGLQQMCFAILSDTQKETPDHFIYSDKKVLEGYDGVTIDGYVGAETEVTIPDYIDGKPVQEINEDAFAYNPVIEKVSISDNVYRILECAFYNCRNLKEVKMSNQIWVIDTGAFSACTSLIEISLPESVQVIGNGIFDQCTSMEAVHVHAEKVYDVDGVLFSKWTGTNDLYFYPPARQTETYCIPDGTEEIVPLAFWRSGNVKNIIIPESVKAVYGGTHGAFALMEAPVNIIYKHDEPTGRIPVTSTFYDLPEGSTITVKNEAMKAAAEAAISENCAGNVTVQIETTPSTGFELEKDSFVLSLWNGETAQLKWTQFPEDTTDNITWTSSDETVAKADPVLGKITPEGYGTCTITGVDESGHTKKVSVLVYDACTRHEFQVGDGLLKDNEHSGCSLPEVKNGQKEVTIYSDGNEWAYAVTDGYAGNMPVRFESSAEDIVKTGRVYPSVYNEAVPWVTGEFTSENYGTRERNYTEIEILGLKPGTATLTAIFDDNGTEIRDSIVVHVVDNTSPDPADPDPDKPDPDKPDPGDPDDPNPDKPDPVKPDPATKKQAQSLKYTKNYQKTYGNKPFSLNVKRVKGDGKLSYKSSDKKVAVVNSKGKVTIKGTGRTIITVTAAATDNYQKKSVNITLNVSPKKAVLTSVKAVKGRKLTVKWKKDAKASGYQLQYSTDKKFKKNVKTVTIKSGKTTSRTVSGLKKGKTYYVRVRSYKTMKVNGKTGKLTGAWSSVKKSSRIK